MATKKSNNNIDEKPGAERFIISASGIIVHKKNGKQSKGKKTGGK